MKASGLPLVVVVLALVLAQGCAGGLFRRVAPPEPPPDLPPPAEAPVPVPPDPDDWRPEGLPIPPPEEKELPAELEEEVLERARPEEPAPPTPADLAAAQLARQGRAQLEAGNPEAAAMYLERALAVAPNRPETSLDLAEAYHRQGLSSLSLGHLRRAEILLGGEAGLPLSGVLLKVDCLVATGQEQEARAVLTRARGRGLSGAELERRLRELR